MLLPSLARADPLGQRLGEVHLVLWRLGMAEKVQESQPGNFTIEATHGYLFKFHTYMYAYI